MQKEKIFQLTKMEGWVNKKIKTSPEINIHLRNWFKKYNIEYNEILDNRPYLFFSNSLSNKLRIQWAIFQSTFDGATQYTELDISFLNKKIWI